MDWTDVMFHIDRAGSRVLQIHRITINLTGDESGTNRPRARFHTGHGL